MSKFLIIKTTGNDKNILEKIANKLLKDKICACVNLISNVHSLYYWNKKLQKDEEYILLIKTLKKNEVMAYKNIKLLHNYKVPEISSIEITNSNKEYFNWLNKNIK